MIKTNLILQTALTDPDITWQVHNCKISEQTVKQDGKLPLMYHYDALPDEVKTTHLLSADLLKQFSTPMTAQDVADKLSVDATLIPSPWFVKFVGTAVLFCEQLQLAIRLKFTNTAKDLDPIYCASKTDAMKIAVQDWHCFGEVFVLNKSSDVLTILDLDDNPFELEPMPSYQQLPTAQSIAILTLIDADTSAQNTVRLILDKAIRDRLL